MRFAGSGWTWGLAIIAAIAGTVVVVANPELRTALIELARAGRRSMHGHSVQVGKAAARPHKAISGPLRVSSVNPRYFADAGGKAVLLVGDHTWYTLQDSGPTAPPAAFDYERFLDFLQANDINFFRMFVWEQAKGSVGVRSSRYIGPIPYRRSGPGLASDDKPKFDLTEFDQTYFDRLRQRIVRAGQHGVYVSVQLFEGFSVQRKPFMAANNPWPGHPFNRHNNINGIDGDPSGNGEGEETETLKIAAITALQEAYVEKVIETVNDLDNVLFEICNECHSDSDAWQEHLIRYIHACESGKSKRHPVGRTVNWPDGENAVLFASGAEWISPNGNGGYYDNPPAADGRKVILNDTDHLCYPCGDRKWVWKSFLRGLNVAFMDPYDCSAEWSPTNCDPNDPAWASLRSNLGYVRKFAARMNLIAMTPRGDLASTGYCLSNVATEAGEYLVYLPSGGSVTVNLSAASGPLHVEWFKPSSGASSTTGAVSGGSTRTFTSPFNGDAVLYIYQRDDVHRSERMSPERGRTN